MIVEAKSAMPNDDFPVERTSDPNYVHEPMKIETYSFVSFPIPIRNIGTAQKPTRGPLTAMTRQQILTNGLSRSPTRAHFQNMPTKPSLLRSRMPGNSACA